MSIELDKPLKFLPNIRSAEPNAASGYTWGKNVQESNILKILGFVDKREDKFIINLNELQKLGISENSTIAERWIVSDDVEFPSIAILPDRKTMLFNELINSYPEQILGKKHIEKNGKFIASIMKQLDCSNDPKRGSHSIQVHPKSGYPNLPAKPEMWKGLGHVYIGWNQNMSEVDIKNAIDNNNLEQFLNSFDFNNNTLIMVDGGIVHAIRYGSFIYEWSKAPSIKDSSKGALKNAGVALYDRTDGKTPRQNKEKLSEGLNIINFSNTFGEFHDFLRTSKEVFSDEKNNKIKTLFLTPEIQVDEIIVSTSIQINSTNQGFPIYLEKGRVEIKQNNKIIDYINPGEERFFPAVLGDFEIHLKGKNPAIIHRWYAPL